MKKTKSNYLGKFKVSKTKLELDGKVSCELKGIDDPSLTLKFGAVNPSINNVIYAEAWLGGQEMLVELVMKNGKRVQYTIKEGLPPILN